MKPIEPNKAREMIRDITEDYRERRRALKLELERVKENYHAQLAEVEEHCTHEPDFLWGYFCLACSKYLG